jgi:hypothetical protein
MLYRGKRSEIHDFRKLSSEMGMRITPTSLHPEIIPGAEDY